MTQKITANHIQKYIKNVFGLVVHVVIVHHFWGRFGAKVWIGDDEYHHLMKITKRELQWGMPHGLIWHEVGHIKTSGIEQGWIKSEINAELWALRDMKRRGYNRLYQEEIKTVKEEWLKGVDCDKQRTYKIAGRKVLEILGILT